MTSYTYREDILKIEVLAAALRAMNIWNRLYARIQNIFLHNAMLLTSLDPQQPIVSRRIWISSPTGQVNHIRMQSTTKQKQTINKYIIK